MNLIQISRKRNFKWHLIFGYANMLLAMTFGVFMVPLYLKYIPSEVFGAWLASGNILVWVAAINPGISTVMQQQVGNLLGQNRLADLAKTITSGLFISISVGFFAALLGILFSEEAVNLLRLESLADTRLMEKAFIAAAVSVGVLLVSDGIVSVIHGLHSSFYVGLFSMLSYLAAILFTVLLLKEGYGVLSIPYGSIVRAVLMVVLNFGYLVLKLNSERIRVSFDRKNMTNIVNLFSYNFLGRFSGIITANSESLIIARYFGADAVAPIVLTKRLPSICQGFVLMIAQALFPSLAHLKGQGNRKSVHDILIRACSVLFWSSGFLVTFFLLFNEEIVELWIGRHLYSGNYFNTIICGSVLVSIIAHFFSEVATALGEIKKSGIANFMQSLLFIPIVWLSISLFGLAGILIGSAISMGAVSGWYYFYLVCKNARLNNAHLKIIGRELVVTALISVILIAGFYFIETSSFLQLAGLAIMFSVAYFLLLLLLSYGFRNEMMDRLISFNILYNKQ